MTAQTISKPGVLILFFSEVTFSWFKGFCVISEATLSLFFCMPSLFSMKIFPLIRQLVAFSRQIPPVVWSKVFFWFLLYWSRWLLHYQLLWEKHFHFHPKGIFILFLIYFSLNSSIFILKKINTDHISITFKHFLLSGS